LTGRQSSATVKRVCAHGSREGIQMTRTVVVLVVVALIGVFGLVLYQEYSRGYQDGVASQKVIIDEAEE